jgi:ATP-dependent Clp protease ATP-binding subunit ClpC
VSDGRDELELRRVLKRLAKAYSHDPDPELLEDDDDFLQAVELALELPFARLAALASDGPGTTNAVALTAIARRGEPESAWVGRTIKQVRRVPPFKASFMLGALAEAREPVVARVLARVDHDWLEDPVLRAVTRFLRRRTEHGEEIAPDAFDHAGLKVDREPLLDQLLTALGDAVGPALREAFRTWRAGQIDRTFFTSLGRLWEVDEDAHATVVGPREAALDAIVAALSLPRPRSLLLIGEHGVGKSTLIAEAVRRLRTRGWTVFEAGAAAINAGQSYVGQLEGRVGEIASRTADRSLLWVFPRLDEALWAGQHNRSPQGLLDALLPHVEAGRIVLLGEIEPAAYELLVRLRPQVATLFEPVRLSPLDEAETIDVGRAWCARRGIEPPAHEALLQAYDLASHYIPGVAAPGSALRLLRATDDRLRRNGGGTITPEALLETLSEATGLPLHVLDPRSPLSIGDVRAFFGERVLGQPEAVECLVERIALVKAGLTDPTRPLGVFLFVGPTGTGKTELAKALAEYLFGSPERLVRLDLSEYKTPESFERVLEDTPHSAGGRSLISSVLQQPFSVVLLDEFEKAHPNVWDLFLQLFDDGRLTGQSGRTADFRHCVIILTSNVGSAIATGLGPGFVQRGAAFNPEGVERAVRQAFRPELVNRLDRVVVFRPLEREHMRELLRHELADVLSRRGLRMRPWAVEWDEAAVDFLLEQGFSADLGARPLKRAVERLLLVPLALAIVERQVPEGDQFLFITARNGDGISVSFIDPDAEESARGPAPARPQGVGALVLDPHGEEVEVSFLAAEVERLDRRIDAWRERKREALEATRAPGFWEDPEHETLARIEYLDRLDAAQRTAQGLLARLSNRSGRGRTKPAKRLVSLLAERLHVLDRACDGLDAGDPADAVLTVRPSSADGEAAEPFAQRLREMYAAWAARRGMRIEEAADGRLAVSGLGAFTILAPEHGLHVLETPRDSRSFDRLTVRVSVEAPDHTPAAAPQTIVRRYRETPSPLVRDAVRGWRTGRLDRVLGGDFDVIV